VHILVGLIALEYRLGSTQNAIARLYAIISRLSWGTRSEDEVINSRFLSMMTNRS
jgi:hypothetical protein